MTANIKFYIYLYYDYQHDSSMGKKERLKFVALIFSVKINFRQGGGGGGGGRVKMIKLSPVYPGTVKPEYFVS